jgi:hypothetical protein
MGKKPETGRRRATISKGSAKGSEPMKRWNFANVAEFVKALQMDCSDPDFVPSQASGWKSHQS